jgi:Flp pilus assembly protein TadD
VLFNKGKYGPASDSYREAIRLNPNLARAHYNRGMALSRLSDSNGAKAEFQEANRLDPTLVAPN